MMIPEKKIAQEKSQNISEAGAVYNTDYFNQLFTEKVRNYFSDYSLFFDQCRDQLEEKKGSNPLNKLEQEYNEAVFRLKQISEKLYLKSLREYEEQQFTNQRDSISYCHKLLDGKIDNFLEFYFEEAKKELQEKLVHCQTMFT
ncbi:hypothetical protein [Enterococcus mundtii]|uniref:hypothetical protein n=1 Tax=Enterococcus mundtii TaxID=53346 RepID=UPI00082422B1|nr:hypothetical protein [Enterococcus mundtii]